MKALTILQPYADLITHGAKRVENRTWQTKYRGPLVIHAGLSKQYIGNLHGAPMPRLGMVIGMATIVDCRTSEWLLANQRKPEFAWVKHQLHHIHGPYCFILGNIIHFEKAIPWKGAQGFWDFPDDQLPPSPERKP